MLTADLYNINTMWQDFGQFIVLLTRNDFELKNLKTI